MGNSCSTTTNEFRVKNCQNVGNTFSVEVFNGDDGARLVPTDGQKDSIADGQSAYFWCADSCNNYRCNFEFNGAYMGSYSTVKDAPARWLIFNGGGNVLHYADPPYQEPSCSRRLEEGSNSTVGEMDLGMGRMDLELEDTPASLRGAAETPN